MTFGPKFAEFLTATVAIMLVPGPSVMFVMARAIAWGKTTAFLTVLGNAIGLLVLSVVFALGLGPLLDRAHWLLVTLQVLGGLYLIYLGRDALKHRKIHAADILDIKDVRPSNSQIIKQGFMVGVLNPKALVFFSAIFTQFVDPSIGSLTSQLLVFGITFALLALVFDGMWAIAVGQSRDWFAKSADRLVALRTFGGCVMVALGLFIIWPQLVSLFK